MNILVNSLTESKRFKEITNSLKLNDGLIKINGIKGSAKSFLIDALKKETKGNTIYISSDELEAKKRYEELLTLNNGEDVYLLPSKDIYFYSSDARSSDIMKDRIKVLSKLKQGDVTVVMCADTLLDKITDAKTLDDYTLHVNLSSSFDMQKLDKELMFMGYEKTTEVHSEGEYATKGGIIDIFPVSYEMPIRIELWGDDVDSIRYFETESQKSVEKISEAVIMPCKDILFDDNQIDDAREVISRLRKASMNQSNIYDNIFDSLEKVESIFYPENLVNFLFADGHEEGIKFDSHLSSVIDYINPKTDLIICDDLNRIQKKCHIEEELFTDYVISEIEKGKMVPYQTNLRHEFEDIKRKFDKYQLVAFSMFDEKWFIEEKHIVNFETRTLDGTLRNINSFKEEIEGYLKQDYKVVILTSTVSEGSNLRAELLNSGVHIKSFDMFDEITFEDNIVYMGIGGLETSFVSSEMNMAIFAADDLVKFKKAIPRKKKNQRAIDSFADLNENDLVVHEKYGIGQFLGIKQTSIPEMVDGRVEYVTKDMVMIRYADGDLGVTVENMNMIQKYIGASDKLPKLNKRNNLTEWNKAKGKTKESVREIAEKLLKLYAIRQDTKGFAFNADNDYQKQFEDDFAYIETNDQLLAIEDVKKDMESDKVMDRLLCGDVGFGKTEVAIRAAFKAVQDAKQVAVLAPTTILVEQHYKTFKQRMKDYPINIEYISRFRTEKEINNALDGLKKGTVDIIIGTHKLLNDKIEFKDLGLLVLDEEQRFGVEQKEKIKSKAENVDTLTMSATPIPRTLHMSMSGIRDISLLEEPPRERRPVQTYVMERNEELIKNAIYKEVAREGQVFYLFNRVKGIQKLTNELRELMPELRIEYAHGTMPKTEMEAVMREFISGKIDVLVSTTIIETGIDIPNANTMLVEDADKMGLAQLYQLKGRVGREKKTAFCYFMYEEGKTLSEEADKRLQALKQFTELGSGLKIAMTDLEIRGAGNLIGVEQSGKLGLVGYDLYCKLLEDAIAELRGEKVQRRSEIKMNLKIDAYIDEDYISDSLTKVRLYKRIASIESKEELEEILNELKDRFGTDEDGDVPANVVNLLYVALLKSHLRKLNVRQVDDKDNHVVFTFEEANEIPEEITSRLLLLGQNREEKFRFDFKDPLNTKLYYKESMDEITNQRLLVTNLIDLIYDVTEGNDLNNYFKEKETEEETYKPKGIRMRKIHKD